jgi:hypothetical protein
VVTYFSCENRSEESAKPLLEKTAYPSEFRLIFLWLEIAVPGIENAEKIQRIWQGGIIGYPCAIPPKEKPSAAGFRAGIWPLFRAVVVIYYPALF